MSFLTAKKLHFLTATFLHFIIAADTLNASSVHFKFTEEMAKKTVTNRACKAIINASDDSNLVVRMAKACATDAVELEAEAEIEQNANTELLDIDVEFEDAAAETGPVDPVTGEVGEPDAQDPEPAAAPY